jgi:hypothetical protein
MSATFPLVAHFSFKKSLLAPEKPLGTHERIEYLKRARPDTPIGTGDYRGAGWHLGAGGF